MRILLVDDQRSLRRSLALMLQNAGYDTADAASGQDALAQLARAPFDLVITDLRMEGMSGIDLLREVKQTQPGLPVILITAYGSIETAVDAMRLGAFDYLAKPFSERDILDKIHASQMLRVIIPISGQPRDVARRIENEIVATTPPMRALLIKIERLAYTDISVLITGETGTGKTKIARLIHEHGHRSGKPFVSINCASVPEQLLESELFGHVRGSFTGATDSRAGLFEEADQGTIFLDEIDTLSPAMQAKLLSVLQDRQIRRVGSNKPKTMDVRVISASNQDLGNLIDRGHFRSDLYFRINGVRLQLPPLRERLEDLRLLLEVFIKRYVRKYGRHGLHITPHAMAHILAYPYPGNVRQLENFVEQMVVFADETGAIDLDALPEDLLQYRPQAVERVTPPDAVAVGTFAGSERSLIENALRKYPHLSDAARELGIGRTTLWRKMREYNIARPGAELKPGA
jgi:DNA-binding NtrC family response regulator